MSEPTVLGSAETWAAMASGVVAFPAASVGGRDVVSVNGPDAAVWLQGQLSQDLDPMGVGDSRLAMLLAPQGHMVALLSVGRLADDHFVLVTDGGHGEQVLERLRRFRLRVKAELELAPWQVICLRGPGAAAVDAGRGGDGAAVGAAVRAAVGAGWPGIEAVDILSRGAPAPGAAAPGVPCGEPGAYEAARIVAGMPRQGSEIGEKTIPHSLGPVVDAAVSFTKGCYTGQELVARMDARGANVPRSLRAVVAGDGASLAEGDEVLLDGQVVGVLTSTAVIPGGPPVGLAFVKRGTPAGAAASVQGAVVTIETLPVDRLLPGNSRIPGG